MKRIIVVANLVLLLGYTVNLKAAAPSCSNGKQITGNAIETTLSNKLVCAQRPGATSKNDKWAEEHLSSSQLWEHAKGSLDKVDPRRQVGTWSRSGNNVVHAYSPTGGTYTWTLFLDADNTTHRFCDVSGVTTVATASIIALPAATATNPCGY